MVKLPPVRKRTSYGDITSGDLVFALFWDRLLGDPGAMREDREMAPIVATKTLNNLLIRFKHGKHDQRSHGRKGRAGKAGGAAYQAARSGGASHSEALAASMRATTTERQAMRTEAQAKRRQSLETQAQRARRAAESGQVTPAQRSALLAKADRLEARSRGEKVGPRQKPAPAAPRSAESPAQAAARARETQIRSQRHESATAFDANGKPIISKDGGSDYVDISPINIRQMRNAEGVVFTHNHPAGWEFPAGDPRRNGNSFSPEDIRVAADAQVAQMRAVTPTRTYYVDRPSQGWNANYWQQEIRPRYERAAQETRSDFIRQIREGRVRPEQAEAEHYHAVWSRVFGELGINYGYTEP
jgi:hypothetical protein